MKRISFKDSGGLNLTQAVLSGRKTMTRRAVPIQVYADAIEYARYESDSIRAKFEYILKHSPYKVGEIVAIRQAYKDIPAIVVSSSYDCRKLIDTAGWTNKMFVKAELMPHHIRITDVRVEMLQDISDEDCLREGIDHLPDGGELKPFAFYDTSILVMENGNPHHGWYRDFNTPKGAFAALIDKVSGRGTWDSNPLVWVYSFERVD